MADNVYVKRGEVWLKIDDKDRLHCIFPCPLCGSEIIYTPNPDNYIKEGTYTCSSCSAYWPNGFDLLKCANDIEDDRVEHDIDEEVMPSKVDFTDNLKALESLE
jgi:predicted RNA-binding Zn-ribbon protein involved in translation (DUF1610 family)